MAHHSARYVLVGGGLASATAAENIRKYDPDGAIIHHRLGNAPALPPPAPVQRVPARRGKG